MLSEEEFQEFLGYINGDLISLAFILKAHTYQASGDPRVLPSLDALLTDIRFLMIGIPIEFGEVRWMAAHALASEYAAQNIMTPIIVKQVTVPIDAESFARLYIENKIQVPWEGSTDKRDHLALDELRRLGKLPVQDLWLNI